MSRYEKIGNAASHFMVSPVEVLQRKEWPVHPDETLVAMAGETGDCTSSSKVKGIVRFARPRRRRRGTSKGGRPYFERLRQ